MDVVKRQEKNEIDLPKRIPLSRRPLRIHENVIARLQTCERKKDSIRGSGLRYMFNALNVHCHQLNPQKLLEALRIVSDNQLFDRRTFYNLYESIAKNLIYFTPGQHRAIIESLSKCMDYSVQNVRSFPLKAYDEAISQLGAILGTSVLSSGDESNTARPNESIGEEDYGTYVGKTDTVYSKDIENTQSLGIQDFDGSPVPLSELNRLILDILRGISKHNARILCLNSVDERYLDAFLIGGSCLENMIMLSSNVNIPYEEIIACSKAVVSSIENVMSYNEEISYTNEAFSTGVLLRYADKVADCISLLLIDKLPCIRSEMPVFTSPDDCGDYYKSVSLSVKLAMFHKTDEIKAAYINGDITPFRMIIDEAYESMKQCSTRQLGVLKLDLQNLISELKYLENMLGRLNFPLESTGSIDVDLLLHFKSKQMMIHRLLSLFDNNGQLIRNQETTISRVEEYMQEHLSATCELVQNYMGKLSTKSSCLLLCMLAESSQTNDYSSKENPHQLLATGFQSLYHHCVKLTAADIVYVIEKCYHRLGYIHHYAARIMLNHAFSRHIISRLDALLAANLHALCLTIPYNIVAGVEYKSIQRMLTFLVEEESVYNPFARMLSNNSAGLTNGVGIMHSQRLKQNSAKGTTDGIQPKIGNPLVKNESHRRLKQCQASSYNEAVVLSHTEQCQVVPTGCLRWKIGATYLSQLWRLIKLI